MKNQTLERYLDYKKSYGRFTNFPFRAVPELPDVQFGRTKIETLSWKVPKIIHKVLL
jgi:hypothetical protein